MTAILALASAFIIGTSDFLLGLGSRGAQPQRVPISSNVMSAVTLLVLAPFLTATESTIGGYAFGALVGVSGTAGFTLYLIALRDGKMSIVAPTTAIISALALVAIGIIGGERLSFVASIGVGLAILAAFLISRSDDPADNEGFGLRSFYLAIAAGVVFALFFWSLGQIPEGAGVWPLLVARGVSLPLQTAIAIAFTGGWRVPRNTLRVTLPAGAFEAIAIVLAAEALRRGPLAIAGVLTGLYPVSTVLLAWVVLHERLGRVQWVAVALAFIAAPLTTL